MRRYHPIIAIALFGALACTGSAPLTQPQGETVAPVVVVNGALTLTVTDIHFVGNIGVMLAPATVQGARGAVTAQDHNYGGLCGRTIAGHADVTANRVVLHIDDTPRAGAICPAGVHLKNYDATIIGLVPGRYDVYIVYSDGGFVYPELRFQNVDVT